MGRREKEGKGKKKVRTLVVDHLVWYARTVAGQRVAKSCVGLLSLDGPDWKPEAVFCQGRTQNGQSYPIPFPHLCFL